MKDSGYDFDHIAETIFYPIYDEITDNLLRKINLQEGRFLDIGCGGGHLGFSLLKKTKMNASFLDIQSSAVETAKRRAADLGFMERSSFWVGDVESMSFEKDTFQLVISRGSMPFWENQEAAFTEIYRVLAPGGKTFVGCGLGNPETREKIRDKMRQNGFQFFGEKRNDESKALTSAEYKKLFFQKGWKHEIIDSPEEGRWIILAKDTLEE
ncbi:class I SAM-dependent methyltransferase [Parasporobacterium paucivorans]|uniref:Methyltransferase domain-containing protein n=1 Tax=Parasporobacterium paucivorans DSM 15970 TaxID=1122934 RepID=A0A1M6EL27_9FIRM|nr:class I SAM-dependent methyltransferase [Parasporobacterium paucivorans]SHI85950.1 Methyltransferase domain-containing protein [Parasporobacterium paucivorans DSM 15970]